MAKSKKNLFPDSKIKEVAEGVVVVMEYKLTGDDGEVIDQTYGDQPFHYIHGAGRIVRGLEKAMPGRKVGEKFKVKVTPQDGYGEKKGEEPFSIKRSEIPVPVEIGFPLPLEFEDEAGEKHYQVVFIVDFNDDEVFMSAEHPLAGKNLNFEVEIIGLREATDEEREHGHTHGIKGDEVHDH